MYDSFRHFTERMGTDPLAVQDYEGIDYDALKDFYYFTCYRQENTFQMHP